MTNEQTTEAIHNTLNPILRKKEEKRRKTKNKKTNEKNKKSKIKKKIQQEKKEKTRQKKIRKKEFQLKELVKNKRRSKKIVSLNLYITYLATIGLNEWYKPPIQNRSHCDASKLACILSLSPYLQTNTSGNFIKELTLTVS